MRAFSFISMAFIFIYIKIKIKNIENILADYENLSEVKVDEYRMAWVLR